MVASPRLDPGVTVTIGGFCVEVVILFCATTKDFNWRFEVGCAVACFFCFADSPRCSGLGATVRGDCLTLVEALSSITFLLLPASCV